MKARITFFIGLAVAGLSLLQWLFTQDPVRFIGLGVGVFFMVWGGAVGWTRYRRLTVLLGHLAVTLGCLVTSWALYQLPFLSAPPTIFEVLDLPLFWGLFTLFGGICMINHGSNACVIRMHDKANPT